MQLKPITHNGEVKIWTLTEDDGDSIILTIVRVENELRIVVAPDYSADVQVENLDKGSLRTYGP